VFIKLNRSALLQSKQGSSRVSNLGLGSGSTGSTNSSQGTHHLGPNSLGLALSRALADRGEAATAFELAVAQGLPYLEGYNQVELVTMAVVSAGGLMLLGDTRNRQVCASAAVHLLRHLCRCHAAGVATDVPDSQSHAPVDHISPCACPAPETSAFLCSAAQLARHLVTSILTASNEQTAKYG
jgi:hypothetical protein